MYLYDYVLFFALEKEFDQFKCALSLYKAESLPEQEQQNKYHEFYSAYKRIHEIDEVLEVKGSKKFKIYATTQNMAGMVSSAICATNLIKDYRPKNIVLLGITAGFGQEFGSVLIADFVSAYQQGKLINGELKFDGWGYPLDQTIKHTLDINKGRIINDVQDAVLKYQRNASRSENVRIHKIGAFIGAVATSIHVIADDKQEKIIKGTNRKAIGVEMEGFGLFHAVAEFEGENKPTPMLIKSVCDHADNKKGDDYQDLAGFTSAYFFLKHLEINTIRPLGNLPQKSKSIFMPFGYNKRNEFSERVIENAPEGSDICFISITGNGELSNNTLLLSAFEKGNKLKGVVVNPNGLEARFRNSVEAPNSEKEETILSQGSSNVLASLRRSWKEAKIEIRYAPVGVQFKLWLSENEAMVEPYHFGKENTNYDIGLCGFSQILFSREDREYKILKDQFNNLWDRAETFWPERINVFSRVEIEINTHCNKKADTGAFCNYCPNSVVTPMQPELMDEKLYKKIIDELHDIDFTGRLSFHFYGEPLLHPNIENLIEYAKDKISGADLVLYTNGDKLNDKKYSKLINSGIDHIVVFNPNKKFPIRPKQTVLRNIHFNNKGGTLGESQTLEVGCFAPTHRLVIGYNGDVLLCYEDVTRQNSFGNVAKDGIMEIWDSEEYREVRENLATGKRSLYKPCRHCNNQCHIKFGQVNVNHFY